MLAPTKFAANCIRMPELDHERVPVATIDRWKYANASFVVTSLYPALHEFPLRCVERHEHSIAPSPAASQDLLIPHEM